MEGKKVVLKIISFGKTLDIEVSTDETIRSLKDKIFEAESERGIPNFNLIYSGKVLTNEKDFLSKILKDEKNLMYVLPSEVHGGCYSKDGEKCG